MTSSGKDADGRFLSAAPLSVIGGRPAIESAAAWRHTFKTLGFRCGISEKVLDAIVRHAPASVGRGYGEPALSDKA